MDHGLTSRHFTLAPSKVYLSGVKLSILDALSLHTSVKLGILDALSLHTSVKLSILDALSLHKTMRHMAKRHSTPACCHIVCFCARSLVPRQFPPTVFDRLQYADTCRGGIRRPGRSAWSRAVMSGRQMVDNQESLSPCLLYLSRSGGQSVCIVHTKRELTICTWVHTHTHIHAHTNTHLHTRTHTHAHTNTHTHTHTHTHSSYMYPNVHLTNTQCSTYHLHTHTHAHPHTPTHTHRWYHPGISRRIAESMLMSREISDGTYLLRDTVA